MDKIYDVFKEKIASPFLSNFFFGLLLFNKKVIYSAFAINYQDRIDDCYYYNEVCFDNKIELLEYIHYNESNLCLPSWCNLFLLPIIYALIITGGLPYIKAFFKALTENADIKYQSLRISMNKLKPVSVERLIEIREETDKIRTELKDTKTTNIDLRSENSSLKTSNDSFEQQVKVKDETITGLEKNIINFGIKDSDLRKDIEVYKNIYINRAKLINEVFEGIWKLDFKSQPPSTSFGIEYFKIVNGYEYYKSDTPNGEYILRAYIDRYKYTSNYKNDFLPTQIYDVIKFKKTYVDANDHYAICEYILTSGDEITGSEDIGKDGISTGSKFTITATKYADS